MPGKEFTGGDKPYLRIIGGNVVQKASKDDQKARKREYTLKDGTEGVAYEFVYMNWEGIIRKIDFVDTPYGENCMVHLDDAVICLPTDNRYFSDFAQKVFSGDITKPFLFHPYDMEVEGKKKRGISLQQQDGAIMVKLKNYFYDGAKNLHGFPEVDQEKLDKIGKSKYWPVYFTEVAIFLIDELKKLEFEKAPEKEKPKETVEDIAASFEEKSPSVDDFPF